MASISQLRAMSASNRLLWATRRELLVASAPFEARYFSTFLWSSVILGSADFIVGVFI